MRVGRAASWDRLALSTRRMALGLTKVGVVLALGTEAPVPVGFDVYPLAPAVALKIPGKFVSKRSATVAPR